MLAFVLPCALLLAEMDPHQPQSRLAWILSSLGFYGLIIPLLGFAILAGSCIVVGKCRPAVIASYLLFVPLPLIIAVFAMVKGMVNGFSVLAMSETELKQWQLAGGLAESGLLLVMGFLATGPSYLVIAIGLFIRTLLDGKHARADG